MSLKGISGWKKAVILIAVFNLLIVLANFVLLSVYGSQIRKSLDWILGNEDKTILSNLLFIEGAITIGIGAFLAGGYAESRITNTNLPSTPYKVEKISKERAEFRTKQISTGIVLILAGLPLILISILIFII